MTSDAKVNLTRRTMRGAGTLPLLAWSFGLSALAQTASAPPAAGEIAPVLFVHGNGDHAAPASENRIAVAELTY